MKAAHHRGRYEVAARQVRAIANANPLTLCWRCRKPLNQHRAHRTGKPATWTAGHTVDGSSSYHPWTRALITSAQCEEAAAGDWLAPEASVCNYRDGRATQDAQRIVTTRAW